MGRINWMIAALLITSVAGAEARTFRAIGTCPKAEETVEDAVRIALLSASETVREQVAACLDSLGGNGAGYSREEMRAFVAGLVEVRRGRVSEAQDSAFVEGACEVDPEALLNRIGEMRRDPALSRDMVLARAETDQLRTRLSEQSDTLSRIVGKEDRERVARQRGETLANLEAKALLTRARVAFETAPPHARALVDSALAIAPRSAEAHLQRGILQHEAGNLDSAIVEYREALRIRPLDAGIRSNLAAAYREKGNLDSAIVEYRRILQSHAPDPEVPYQLATALKDRGALDSAIVEYRETLRIAPGHLQARADLGTALHLTGNLDSAVVEYRRVLRADSNDVRIRYNLGTALKELRRTDEAIEAFQKVLQISPDLADAHFNLGAALAAKGDRPGTLREMRAFLRLSKDEQRKEQAREVIQAYGGIP